MRKNKARYDNSCRLGMWGHAQWAFILKLNLFEKTRPLCKERSKGKTLKSQFKTEIGHR